jgi:hypothetical protein
MQLMGHVAHLVFNLSTFQPMHSDIIAARPAGLSCRMSAASPLDIAAASKQLLLLMLMVTLVLHIQQRKR